MQNPFENTLHWRKVLQSTRIYIGVQVLLFDVELQGHEGEIRTDSSLNGQNQNTLKRGSA
ncbi:hypothetical protein [Sphingobacterium mizutaii]|uniref:hypothetical protein n=1 Tax=Sphingobacterium mizutaii TaxID=1010 RepID=UPI001628EE16|nr:hypothetical protein [Sphingobacterium mizutaii]